MNGPQDDSYKMVAEFKKRRDIIVDGLNRIPGIRCSMPKGAFYAFPSVEATGMSSREFADGLLEDAGVACLAGESFGEYGKGCVRFSFANSVENIERALERIEGFVARGRDALFPPTLPEELLADTPSTSPSTSSGQAPRPSPIPMNRDLEPPGF